MDRPSNTWHAIAYGALDVTGVTGFDADIAALIVPAVAGDVIGLRRNGSELWQRLVGASQLATADVSEDEEAMLREFCDAGIASRFPDHPAAVRSVPHPTLSSPLHELVYALIANVARDRGIRVIFIKGPALYRQGIRAREHSGDVDVWCEPARVDELSAALEEWGWKREPDLWRGTPVFHSVTLTPLVWGCEIDIHRRVPGLTLDDPMAFDRLAAHATTVEYASFAVAIPNSADHAVLAALNDVRPQIGGGARSDRPSLAAVEILRAVDGSVDSARRLGAIPALRAELSHIVPSAWLDADVGVPRDWRWRERRSRVSAYFSATRSLPIRDRVAVIVRLLWPADDVALASARRAGDDASSAARAKWKRLGRGLRTLKSVRRRVR